MNTLQKFLAAILFLLSPYALCETSPKVPLAPDGFGTTLPAGLTSKVIVQLIAPGKDASLATLVGMKAWPHKMNTFIAIACLASTKKDYDIQMSSGSSCSSEWGDEGRRPPQVYLAMLEYRENDVMPKVIASYGKPLDVKTNWQYSNLDSAGNDYTHLDSDGNDRVSQILPETYTRFDFAPFKVAENETAFGIRVGWSQAHAGGGEEFEALMLFIQDTDRIINILSEPISFSNDVAGEWHEEHNGLDHSFTEGKNVVIVLPHKTNGHFDLQLMTPHEKWKQVFAWDSKGKRYQPISTTPPPSKNTR